MLNPVVVQKQDKSICIIYPTNECTNELLLRDIKQIIGYLNHYEITKDQILKDRYFREAWEYTDKLNINISKANDIHRQRLRILRQPLLAKLDIEYMRADEIKDEGQKSVIMEKKQRLRDITNFKDSPDLEVLKTYKLNELNNI